MRYYRSGVAILSILLLASAFAWGEGAWELIYGPSRGLSFYDVSFVDSQYGWAVARDLNGNGFIAHRGDDGIWRYQLHVSRFYPEAIQFLTREKGWIAGWRDMDDEKTEGMLLSTEDGGENWIERHRFPWEIRQMQFVDERNGWAAGIAVDADGIPTSVILATHDGGENWAPQYEAQNAVLIDDLCFADVDNGWVVGWFREQAGSKRVLLHTTDGGKNWTRVPLGALILAVDFVSASEGWAVGKPHFSGQETIFHTQDGGRTWAAQRTVSEEHASWPYPAICFVDEGTGWRWVVLSSTLKIAESHGRSIRRIFPLATAN